MKSQTKNTLNSGHLLLESLLAITIASIIAVYLMDSVRSIFNSQIKSDHRVVATQYAIEGMELIHNLNANLDWSGINGFSALADDPTKRYYPEFSPTPQHLVEGQRQIDNLYTQELRFGYAWRDAEGNLLEVEEPGSSQDTDFIQVTSRVFWDENGQSEEVVLMNYFVNLEALQ